MHVVATAGHVDHGKSTLIRALTGMEPDRWAEERRRGMTIDLGYAWTTLPSGARVAFVDVPGHERFMTNMLAGVGPAPAVLFVVAADEGWRAQSSEHLTALDLLGVRRGVLVVTRAGLADPQPARYEARQRLAGTTLEGIPAVAVDSVSGQGMTELRTTLDRLLAGAPAPDRAADVRLWVDRVFTLAGAGTVVTGTLNAGRVRVGDELWLLPGGEPVRIRTLEALRERHDEVYAVARVAVNLRRVDRGRLRRGDALVTPERWLPVSVFDGRLSGGVAADELPTDLVLHIGSAAVPARLRRLDRTHARLTLRTPLPLRIGDVALLRDPARRLVLAGVTVLDPLPPPIARRGGGRLRAAALVDHPGVPDATTELRRRRLARATVLRAMGMTGLPTPVLGDWLADPQWWRDAQRHLVTTVEAYAEDHPDDPGMPLEVARQALALPAREVVRALADAADGVGQRAGRLYAGRRRPVLPGPLRDAIGQIRRELLREPFQAPSADRLAQLGLDRRRLAAAVGAGELLRVAEGIYLLPGADREALRRLAVLDQPFPLAAARDALRTTRRVLVPLLELLASRGWTERVGSGGHRVLRRHPDEATQPGDGGADRERQHSQGQ